MQTKKKTIYLCLIHPESGGRFYYRQEWLTSLGMWGTRRPISKRTFIKRKMEGHHTEYLPTKEIPHDILCKVNQIDALIDFALDTRDKTWFDELVEKKRALLWG